MAWWIENNNTAEVIELLSTQDIADKNNETAIKFAESNSDIAKLPANEFKDYNNSWLLQSKLPLEYHKKEKLKTETITWVREIKNPDVTTNPGGEGTGWPDTTWPSTTPNIIETIKTVPYNKIKKGKNFIRATSKIAEISDSDFLDKIHSMNTQELVDLVKQLEEKLINSENSEEITELDKGSNIRKIKYQIEDIENLLNFKNKKTSKTEIDNFPSQNEKWEYNVI